eukprot:1607022-Pyramimonas_sp.AAC.1
MALHDKSRQPAKYGSLSRSHLNCSVRNILGNKKDASAQGPAVAGPSRPSAIASFRHFWTKRETTIWRKCELTMASGVLSAKAAWSGRFCLGGWTKRSPKQL